MKMRLRETIGWTQSSDEHLPEVERMQSAMTNGSATKYDYYFFPGAACFYAINCYLEGDAQKTDKAARLVVSATLKYFYGDWRKQLPTPDGKVGHEEWKPFCLWYEQVMRSLPWACAERDWVAVRRIAEYPPENKLPEAAKVKGETAWGWALIAFLRGRPKEQVEHFLAKAEADKAKRPKLLCLVLRALMDNDAKQFEKTLLAYLAYYRKSEFKRQLSKLLALDGTTLYHLGRKHGYIVSLPEDVAEHIIQLPDDASGFTASFSA